MKQWTVLATGLLLTITFAASPAQAGILFYDSFNTDNNPNGDGWYDVNHQFNLRQSGSFAPRTYNEDPNTATGGGQDYRTQVNNPGLRNTLLLATSGSGFTWVSPNQDFNIPGFTRQTLHVEINPLGPASGTSPDHWAALVFGTTQGNFIISPGTGVLVRDTGEYELWDNGSLVSTGNIGAKTSLTQFYSIDFGVDLVSGDFSLSIDGNPIFSGNHGGAYGTDFVTLEDFTSSGSGNQVDYLDNLTVTAVPEPASLTLAGLGVSGLLGFAWRIRKRGA